MSTSKRTSTLFFENALFKNRKNTQKADRYQTNTHVAIQKTETLRETKDTEENTKLKRKQYKTKLSVASSLSRRTRLKIYFQL